TGMYSNFHEIRNLVVEVSANDELLSPTGSDLSDFRSCAGQENSYSITEEDVKLPNEGSVIRCLQFYQSVEDIAAESADICSQARCLEQNRYLILPQGTFRASDEAGGFTFFPNEDYIGQEVTVHYTNTDNYGKNSQGNAITLKIEESPAPIRLSVSGTQDTSDHADICHGETVILEGLGDEAYERFEWRKDGTVLAGATGNTFAAAEEGAYEVIGYNRKNCPAVSNVFRVELPDLPVLELVSRLIGCTAGQPVDLASQIPGYDIALFDYRFSGMGFTYYNGELSVIGTGSYELSVKLE